ncbi:6855_t:CDS:2, partial [Cetraspora pellucida]
MSVAPSTLDINELFDVSSQVEAEDSTIKVPNGELPRKKQKGNGQIKDIKDVEIPPLPEVARQDLIARNYQIELFEKAKKDNVIAVLDTGSGKTFIAVMLIKEIAAEERLLRMQRRETKLTFFLVNLVPLVFQQANVIKANCDLKVKHFCGEMGVDLWSEKEWRNNFENYDVLVMTAQIFLNILRHGFISLSQVNLLVFDECHHTSKKHPYNLIMREFYDRCPEESKPKIFGMTASPVNTRSALHAARYSEFIAGTHIALLVNQPGSPPESSDEVCKFVSRPDEIAIKYDTPPTYPSTELYNKLREEYLDVEKFNRALTSARQALQALGPWCSDRVWKYILDEMHEKCEGKLSPEFCAESQEEERLVRKAMDIVKGWNFQSPKREQEVLSPKVIQLINILKCFKNQTDNFCGIVFVERRHTANVLHLLIKEIEELYFIKPGVLVGHGSHEEGDLQMKFKEQNKTISAFRDGRINLLIATNVAEEGLDIQPCNVVIRFDFFNTLRAYIQSRGRARRKDSKYIVMIENNNFKEYGILREMKQAEKDMKDWCQMLPEDRKLPDFNIERENGGGFTCNLSLPNNAPIRLVSSEVSPSRSNAKKAAAFKACLQLYEKKALNDHLLPEIEWIEEDHEMTKPVKDEFGLVEGARKSKREYHLKNPDLWNNDEDMPSIPDKIYVTVLKLELEDEKYDGQYYRTMCLLTRKQLPDVPLITLYFHGVAKVLNVLPYSVPISIESEDLEIIFKFTLRIFTSITNKEFVCEFEKFTYLVAPLVRNAPINENFFDYIDWEGMRRAVNEKHLPIDLDNISDLEDAVIIDYSDNLRRYFVQTICHDLNPLSPIPDGMAIREVGCQNFAEFYKKHFDLELKHAEQPLLHVRKISKVMNFLQPVPGSLPIQKGRTATYVIPEFCKQYSIRASVFRSALMLPAIFTRLDSQLLALELRTRFDIPIRDDLLLEAITTPSANMEMNYERLETLGDSFLKFCVTNRLYVMFPDKHEGQLHCQRIRIICNRQLYRGARKLQLYEYITSSPFNRRAWRPANMLANIDDANMLEQKKVHELADKTLADVVEAMLGAAYMSGQVDAALKCAIALEIQMEDITKWNDFHANNKNRPRVNAKALERVNVERIEEICGHNFKNKTLIVEALTHASLPNSVTPCYQRLEFLGDAVLDFMVVKYLFEKYPDGEPGIMTDLKDAAVNNQVLGAICERINLHKHIIHFSSKLTGGMTEFVNAVKELREKNEAVGEYWSELDVPKVMSDVVESMMGAIFVDSEFDPAALQNVFDKWIKPILTVHVTPETLKVHPVKKLTEYMQKEGCFELLL